MADGRVYPRAIFLGLSCAVILQMASSAATVVGSHLTFRNSTAELHTRTHILRMEFCKIEAWEVRFAELGTLSISDPYLLVLPTSSNVPVFKVRQVCRSAANGQQEGHHS